MKMVFFIVFFAATMSDNFSQSFDWAISCGGSDHDYIRCIETDGSSNTYYAGFYTSQVDLDPTMGLDIHISNGYRDAFISKINQNGTYEWSISFGGAGYDLIQSVSATEQNILVTGFFSDTLQILNNGINQQHISNGDRDVFIASISPTGNINWFKTIGGSGEDYGNCINIGNQGNIYITGTFQQNVTLLSLNSLDTLFSNGGRDAFIFCLDSTGNLKWSNSIGGVLNDYGYSIISDTINNAYVAGSFRNLVDFNPGSGFSYEVSKGLYDGFILKLDSIGQYSWSETFGGSQNDIFRDLTILNNQIIGVGFFEDSIEYMFPDSTLANISSNGGYDIMLRSYSLNGASNWARSVGGPSNDFAYSVEKNLQNQLLVSGNFTDSIDSGLPGMPWIHSNGGSDVFLLMTDSNGTTDWFETFGGSNSEYASGSCVKIDNQVLTGGYFYGQANFEIDSGSFEITSLGATDFFIHRTNYCQDQTYTQAITSCGPYTWINGITYYESSDSSSVTYSSGSQHGCDSTILLDLTIHNNETFTDTVTSCGPFTWNNGITYFESTDTVSMIYSSVTEYGCDSLVYLDLTITNLESIVTQLNDSTLEASNGQGDFQWINCNNNYAPILNANQPIFTTDTNGSFALITTENSCIDTSECYEITLPDYSFINEDPLQMNSISIYPNPSSGVINLVKETDNQHIHLEITDMYGRSIESGHLVQDSYIFNLPSGCYLFHLRSSNSKKTIKVIKHE